jgi:hypothetical protein
MERLSCQRCQAEENFIQKFLKMKTFKCFGAQITQSLRSALESHDDESADSGQKFSGSSLDVASLRFLFLSSIQKQFNKKPIL